MNRSALLFGPVFLVLGGAYLLDDLGVIAVSARILLPLVVILAGLVLAASSLLPERGRP
jgi:hypothetical protein